MSDRANILPKRANPPAGRHGALRDRDWQPIARHANAGLTDLDVPAYDNQYRLLPGDGTVEAFIKIIVDVEGSPFDPNSKIVVAWRDRFERRAVVSSLTRPSSVVHCAGVKTVDVVVVDDVFDSALALTMDVLRTAQWMADTEATSSSTEPPAPLRLRKASVDGKPVRSALGSTVFADSSLDDLSEADVVVLPGFWATSEDQVERRLKIPDIATVGEAVAAAHGDGKLVAGGCTGTFMIAHCGILDGLVGTTTWWLAPLFEVMFPQVKLDVARMVTYDERVLCSGAAMAHMDLSLALVSREMGPALADRVGRLLLLEGRPSQAKYMAIEQLARGNPDVVRAEQWVRDNLETEFRIEDLARALGMSTRTLNRRFQDGIGMSPRSLVRRIRTEAAVHLLETTDLSIEAVATRVGVGGEGALRRLVKEETGRVPSAYRRR